MMLPMISEKEFCEHIEDDDFPIRYGNPVCIHTNDGQLLVCMTYKLYERLLERKEQVTGNEFICHADKQLSVICVNTYRVPISDWEIIILNMLAEFLF